MMENLTEFLTESNKIEGVYDSVSVVQARKAWDYIVSFDVLAEGNVLRTHEILMEGKLPEADLGTYRKVNRWQLEGKKTGTHFEDIPDLMRIWCQRVGTATTSEHIVLDHVAFEQIHPFIDGNGRMGRLLMNWQRTKLGLPLLVIKEVEKAEYMRWFK